MKPIEIKNNADLRKALIEQINAVREGKCDARESNAVGNLVGKILQTIKVDLLVLKHFRDNSDKDPAPPAELPSAKLTTD